MTPSSQDVDQFQSAVWGYYRTHARSMPWRDDPTPYRVLVSELMLQQTQVGRVIPKFEAFIDAFPDISTLAVAPLGGVLGLWNGLGYNRRAKYLHETARQVIDQYDGILPDTFEKLTNLPGIGPNTAGALLVYAHNQPVVYIETNIRTVYFHHFYADHPSVVADRELRALVELTLDREHPREWYWALMDYGSYLKKTTGGRLQQSAHYKKQSPLAGSLREMRGQIIKQLSTGPQLDTELRRRVAADKRYQTALQALVNEGMIEKNDNIWCLTGAA